MTDAEKLKQIEATLVRFYHEDDSTVIWHLTQAIRERLGDPGFAPEIVRNLSP